jgi:hypothetical protein
MEPVKCKAVVKFRNVVSVMPLMVVTMKYYLEEVEVQTIAIRMCLMAVMEILRDSKISRKFILHCHIAT